MKKYIYILFLIFLYFYVSAHTKHYKGIIKIEMEVFRNNKSIGYSNYFFEHENDAMTVKNYTQFKVKLLGSNIFSIDSEAVEKYKKEKLVHFRSTTFQNGKEKYVNLNYNKPTNKFIIDGSSYKGEADADCLIGSWWNHQILKANKQISPLTGSIKDQVVQLVGNENIILYGKNYNTNHYKLKSKNDNLPKNKKLDFDIWVNIENNLIVKVAYSRMGNWEYRLKDFKIN